MLPNAPVFMVNPRQRFIGLHRAVGANTRFSLDVITYLDPESLSYYDAEGTIWSFRFDPPVSAFSVFLRFLATSFRIPVPPVAITWTALRTYNTDELRRHYLDAIAVDDDILTQFVESEELGARVRACTTFEDLVDAWTWQSTDDTGRDVENIFAE